MCKKIVTANASIVDRVGMLEKQETENTSVTQH